LVKNTTNKPSLEEKQEKQGQTGEEGKMGGTRRHLAKKGAIVKQKRTSTL